MSMRSGFNMSCRRAFVLVAALLLVAACVMPCPRALAAQQAAAAEDAQVQDALAATAAVFRTFLGVSDDQSIFEAPSMVADDSTAQWLAFDFKRLGAEPDASRYLAALEEHVTRAYANPPVLLDAAFSTEWNQLAIIVKTLGADPTSFGTGPDGKKIDLVADGSYNWVQKTDIGVQGANGWIYALAATDVAGVRVPEDARYTQEQMIEGLLSYQNENGSFSLNGTGEDLDITAMAICALSRHADTENVYAAVSRALAFLSKAQGPDGRFTLALGSSAEAQAQCIIALCSAGLDPRTAPDFVKSEGNALSGLLLFQREDGSFSHNDESAADSIEVLPTEQALRALIAVAEFDQGGDGNVYTSDVALDVPNIAHVQAPVSARQVVFWVVVGIVAALAVVAVLYARHKLMRKRMSRS